MIDSRDIQAIFSGVPPSLPHAHFYFLQIADRRFLQRIGVGALEITSARTVRAGSPERVVNLAFTEQGLAACGMGEDVRASFSAPFREGMLARASYNGDVGDSDPEHWDACWSSGVHAMVACYATTAEDLARYAAELEQAIEGVAVVADRQIAGIVFTEKDHPVYLDNPECQPPDGTLVEQFGFRDGISDVALEGWSEGLVRGAGKLVDDAWAPVASGEFLWGYRNELAEYPPAPKPESLARNGTYLVYRKLEQDVRRFREYLLGAAERSGLSADAIAAQLVGRQRDGTPLIATPGQDVNDFRYASDPEGRVCPMGAHVRRTNPRDSLGPDTLLINHHRLMRRGISYGSRYAEASADEQRGLVFMALNASISDQFEFIQQQWVNSGNDLFQGDQDDPITGQKSGKHISVTVEDTPLTLAPMPAFVRMRGGDYFFLPSLSALREMTTTRFN